MLSHFWGSHPNRINHLHDYLMNLGARGFDRQVAEARAHAAVTNRYTALGVPVTKVAGYVFLGKGAVLSAAALRNATLRK